MDNQIAQFIDNYTDADQHIYMDMETITDVDKFDDSADELTPFESFCYEADAWARQALASNGFGDF